MGRTGLSKRELQRGGVLARVKAGDLRIKDAARDKLREYLLMLLGRIEPDRDFTRGVKAR